MSNRWIYDFKIAFRRLKNVMQQKAMNIFGVWLF